MLKFKLFILLYIIFLPSLCFSEIKLYIDTVFLVNDTSKFNNKLSITINIQWSLCNEGEKKVSNLNELWYIYPYDVKTDSMYLKRSQRKIKYYGVGNTKVYLCNDKDTLEPGWYGFIETPLTNDSRFDIKPQECKNGIVSSYFTDLKSGIYMLKLRYITEYQLTENVPLWRGDIYSNNYMITIP